MSAALRRARERFDALSLRERRLASVAAALVAVALVYALGVAPAERASRKFAAELEAARSQQDAQRLQLEQVRLRLAQDPDAAAKTELAALRAQLDALDGDLAALRTDLVSPQQMLALVRALVARRGGRELVALRALPPEPVRFEPPAAADAEPAAPIGRRPPAAAPAPVPDTTALPTLYRHAVELELRADYNAVLAYLREIEALPARLRVERLQVDSSEWPRLQVRLRIQTLSLREGWAGV